MSEQYSRSGPSGKEIYGRGPTPDSGEYIYGRGPNRAPKLPQYQYDLPSPTPAPAPTSDPPPLPPAPEPIDPKELAAVLFGQNIPIAIGSSLQIGGRIIEGPQYLTLDGASSVNAVSFIAGYYIPINYNTAGRAVTELWFRGQKAWTEDDGSLMPPTAPVLTVGGATTGTEQRVRFTTGVLNQAADAWSIGRHGAANAIAYRPMVTGVFENIRLEQFGHLIPFTSVTVTDAEWGDPGDLVPWSDLIEYLAQIDMRWSFLYGIREFDTLDVTGGVESLILGSPIYFTEFLAGMRKIKPYWHLRTEDRLWVVEKGPYSLDLTVEMSKVQARGGDPVTIHMADAKENNQEVIVSYLDRDRDYERTTVRAAMEITPLQTTDAFKSETVNVPVVSTMDEMIVAANLALFSQDMEREQSEFTGLTSYLGMQPGDTMAIPTDERTYFHAAFEIVRKPDLTTEVKARGFLTCASEDLPMQAAMIADIADHANFSTPSSAAILKDSYLYWLPAWEDAPFLILRQPQSDYSDTSTLEITTGAIPTNSGHIQSATADDTYIYMYSSAVLGGSSPNFYHSALRRLHEDFSTINAIDLGTSMNDDFGVDFDELYSDRMTVLGTWLYLPSEQGGNGAPSMGRLSTADFSTGQTLTISSPFSPSTTVVIMETLTDGEFVYAVGAYTDGALEYIRLYKINTSSFTVEESLELYSRALAAGGAFGIGTIHNGFAYFVVGTFQVSGSASLCRVNLDEFDDAELFSLTGFIGAIGPARNPCVAGNYLYFGDRNSMKIYGISLFGGWSSSALVEMDMMDINPQIHDDYGEQTLHTMMTDGSALYVSTYPYVSYGFKVRLLDGNQIDMPAQPPNDDFADAITMTTGVTATGSNALYDENGFSFATAETGEPNPGGHDESTVWWKWVATGTGSFTVNMVGSDNNDGNGWALGVYTGLIVSSLTNIAQHQSVSPPPSVTFSATSGTTYYFQVGGWGASSPDPLGRDISIVVS